MEHTIQQLNNNKKATAEAAASAVALLMEPWSDDDDGGVRISYVYSEWMKPQREKKCQVHAMEKWWSFFDKIIILIIYIDICTCTNTRAFLISIPSNSGGSGGGGSSSSCVVLEPISLGKCMYELDIYYYYATTIHRTYDLAACLPRTVFLLPIAALYYLHYPCSCSLVYCMYSIDMWTVIHTNMQMHVLYFCWSQFTFAHVRHKISAKIYIIRSIATHMLYLPRYLQGTEYILLSSHGGTIGARLFSDSADCIHEYGSTLCN